MLKKYEIAIAAKKIPPANQAKSPFNLKEYLIWLEIKEPIINAGATAILIKVVVSIGNISKLLPSALILFKSVESRDLITIYLID